MPLSTLLRITGLGLADMVMEGTFFLMQDYLTDVWKLSFTNAAAFLNIWGGIYRILPFFFVFLADTLVGNFVTLALSGIFSTTGLFLVTASALPVYRCEHKDAAECSGVTERSLFITGMTLIALGRAARFASAKPFLYQQMHNPRENHGSGLWLLKFNILAPLTSVVVNLAFPYAKKWYLLFGVSAIYTASATIIFLSGVGAYDKYSPIMGNPITDIFQVFVATAFKISQPYPDNRRRQFHRKDGEEFQDDHFLLSPRLLRFLYKAAIKLPHEEGRENSRRWRLCSVSQVELTITAIRSIPFVSSFIMCGVVSSTGSTYFVEQVDHMKYKIGGWQPPAQVIMSLFLLSTLILGEDRLGRVIGFRTNNTRYGILGAVALICSTLCCTVAAAVERRRLHAGTRHGLLDVDDAKIPMNAGWLMFQVIFLALQEPFMVISLTEFVRNHTPESLQRFQNCIIEGATGIGFICSALVVYVVGKISETGGNPNWFQGTLNKSRLDRYYWVLAALSSVNLLLQLVLVTIFYRIRGPAPEDEGLGGAEEADT